MEEYYKETKEFQFSGKDRLKAIIKISRSDEYTVIDCRTECGHWAWEEEYSHNLFWNFADSLVVERNRYLSGPEMMRYAIQLADNWFNAVDQYRLDFLSVDQCPEPAKTDVIPF